MMIQRKGPRRVVAGEEVDIMDEGAVGAEGTEGDVTVEPEATDLLFEAEDVAELIAEVTGEAVDVTAEEESVTFAVGDSEFTVEAEGNEEILESVRRPLKGKRTVAAGTQRKAAQSRVAASTTARKPAAAQKSGRTVRKLPSSMK